MSDDEPVDLGSRRLTIGQRVGLVERDLRAHSRSITEIVQSQRSLDLRLGELEEWKVTREIAAAREDERDKSLGERLGRIESSIADGLSGLKKDISSIRGFGWKIFWIAATPVVTAIVVLIAIGIIYGVKLAPPLLQ